MRVWFTAILNIDISSEVSSSIEIQFPPKRNVIKRRRTNELRNSKFPAHLYSDVKLQSSGLFIKQILSTVHRDRNTWALLSHYIITLHITH